MSLHALAYCERLFYLEDVEEMRVADERVYAGRRLHVEIEKKEDKRDRKGNVLAQPDVARRKKKATATKNEKPAWEAQGDKLTQPNADETAQAESLRYNDADSSDRGSSPTVKDGSAVEQAVSLRNNEGDRATQTNSLRYYYDHLSRHKTRPLRNPLEDRRGRHGRGVSR